MMRRSKVRRQWWILGAALALSGAAAGSAIAVASSTNATQDALFTVGQGVRVPSQLISDQEQTALSASGATDQLYLLGRRGDHSYYRAVGADGRPCYAVGSDAVLFAIACLHSDTEMPTALFDMGQGVLSPAEGALPRVVSVEGIAADQVAAVGIQRSDGTMVTTPVADNCYRFAPDAIRSDAAAIVALDASGGVIDRSRLR
jgi:hypothetical protein